MSSMDAAALAISVAELSIRLAKFIKNLNDDVHEIHEWLLERQASIDALHRVQKLIETVTQDLRYASADLESLDVISEIVKAAEFHAGKILAKLPEAPGNGALSKMEAVFRKLMADRSITEHEVAIQRWTGLLHTAVLALLMERIPPSVSMYEERIPAPAYQQYDTDFDDIKRKLDDMFDIGFSSTRAPSVMEPREGASNLSEPTAGLSLMHRAKRRRLQQHERRVAELESDGRLLEASIEQGDIIRIRRGLNSYTPFTAQKEALLVEKQADLLLRCFTASRHFEAVKLLEKHVLDDRGPVLSDEINGRMLLKIGEVYLNWGVKVGRRDHIEHANTLLEKAANLLKMASPSPDPLFVRAMKPWVRALEVLDRSEDAESLREVVEEEAGSNNAIEWASGEGGEGKALAWCRQNGFDVNSRTFEFDVAAQGASAMHAAAGDGQCEVLREMLVEIKDVDVRDDKGLTPLLIAADKREPKVLELLLNRKADLHAADSSERTALHRCQTSSRHGKDILIAKMIHDGAPDLIDARDSTGKTALWLACEKGNEKMVGLLLGMGANPNIASDRKTTTPLQIAVDERSSPSSPTRRADRLRIIDMLLEHGADSNASDAMNNTPLHVAASNGDSEVVRLLLRPGLSTSIDKPGRGGQTPIAAAAQHRHLDVVRQLALKNASVSSKGTGGKSAEEHAQGEHNKALREALRGEASRRASETSRQMGRTESHATVVSSASSSTQSRTSSFRFPFRSSKDETR